MARILITDGFGLEAARQLVERKHTVYLHARNQQRAEDAKAKCPGAAGVLIGDVTNVAETRKLAEDANAVGTFDATPDTGVPAVVFVNVLAPYILTCLLNRPKRLVYTASILHFQANPDLKDMWWFERGAIGEVGWDEFQGYCDSKMQDTSVTTLHPGYVPTKLAGNEATDKMEDGIETYITLAEGDYDRNLTGVYFVPNPKIGQPLPATSDEDLQGAVVKACEEFTSLELEVLV